MPISICTEPNQTAPKGVSDVQSTSVPIMLGSHANILPNSIYGLLQMILIQVVCDINFKSKVAAHID